MDFSASLAQFYGHDSPEELRLMEGGAQHLEFLTAAEYVSRGLPPHCTVLDSCAGTGVYSFYLAERGHAVTAGDLVHANVEKIRLLQKERPLLREIYQGDALDLSRFADSSFDAVLLMGALYHLPQDGPRRRAVEEALRVLRGGGLLVCTYMNRYGVIMNDLDRELENLDEVMRFLREGREGVFYASTPEEMGGLMDSCGVEVLSHIALDGMALFMTQTSGLLGPQGAARWKDYHLATCEVPSLLGASYHNMIIGRVKQS